MLGPIAIQAAYALPLQATNIQPTPDIQTLFADDFSFPLSTAKWDFNHFQSGGSFYGRTQQRQNLPSASDGVLHLQLDTFNPTGPGVSFLGAEIVSVPTFSTAAGGIAFNIAARIATPVGGIVGGLFGFNLVDPATGIHNELDTELLGNDAAAGRNRVVTNVYSNDPPGSGHPLFVPVSDLTAFHNYRMEWFADRVRWFVDGQFVREDTAHVPQGALALRLNIWAPDATWTDAYSASLQPVASEAANASFFVDVDSARVAQLAPLQPTTTGGRFVISSSLGPIVLGINDGTRPVFPTPQAGAYNIEIFTNPTIAGVPAPDSGWNTTAAAPGGTIERGFLTGIDLRLGLGDFLVVDSVTGAATQGPARITLGQGAQTVVGAGFDTLVGGASSGQILSALLGNEHVIGGSGNASVWGGANASIVAGSAADQQIVVVGAGTTVVAGMSGAATIALAASDTVLSLPGGTQNVIIAAGRNNLVDLTGNAGLLDAVIGATGDTIVGGAGTTNIEGAAGGMLIRVGAGGTTNLSGSANQTTGNTIIGGAGGFNFNPGAAAGVGDLIDLSGSGGTATINAFAFQSTRIASSDTVLGTNNADSVFGGDGDRIGIGSFSVVGGTHQWSHADTLVGSSVGFGSNDTVSSTIYDTVTGSASRGTVAGTSSAQVTVGGFDTASDYLFYQNETAATNAAIIATAQSTTVGGAQSSIVTLPDGTVMTLVGVTQAQLTPTLFRP